MKDEKRFSLTKEQLLELLNFKYLLQVTKPTSKVNHTIITVYEVLTKDMKYAPRFGHYCVGTAKVYIFMLTDYSSITMFHNLDDFDICDGNFKNFFGLTEEDHKIYIRKWNNLNNLIITQIKELQDGKNNI